MGREPGTNRILSVVGLSAGSRVPPLCGPLRRRCATAGLLLLGSVSGDGLRPTDLPGRPSRHRSMPAIFGRQAVPHGLPRPRVTLHVGRRHDAHDWRIYAEFAQVLIRIARPLYASDPIGVDLDQSLYALDSTTIDLCLSLFPWAKFRKHKAAVKMHTLLDLHGNIPTFISITSGKVHDVNILDEILPESGAFYVMDRGYVDFERLYVFTLSAAFFVVRTKSNILLQRRYSHPVDKSTGIRSDHTVILTAIDSAKVYPDPLRRVTYFDAETNQRLKFLTHNFLLPALTVTQIYKCRWQVELF